MAICFLKLVGTTQQPDPNAVWAGEGGPSWQRDCVSIAAVGSEVFVKPTMSAAERLIAAMRHVVGNASTL